MSKNQRLRALVKERLSAAADEIFALFERTIAEYEEELYGSKEEENRGKQQRLDSVLSPNIAPVQGGVQIRSTGPGPGLNDKIIQTLQIKEEPEEQEVKQEEEQLPGIVPDSFAVCVKSEEFSLLQQEQSEHQDATQEEDTSDTDNNKKWGPPSSCSSVQMETEADGDCNNQAQTRERCSAAQTSHLSLIKESVPETSAFVNCGDGDAGKKHQCSVCKRRFKKKDHLQTHKRVHTGEKPYRCSICQKAFAHKSTLDSHGRTHTGEKPFSCLICNRDFAGRFTLKQHLATHTGERPYCCPVCNKTFSQNSTLYSHMKTHRGTSYSCSLCNKAFTSMENVKSHLKTHGQNEHSHREASADRSQI